MAGLLIVGQALSSLAVDFVVCAHRNCRDLVRQAHNECQNDVEAGYIFLARRPIRRPKLSRRIVTSLSAITCDLTRNPLIVIGSIVTQDSVVSLNSGVI